MQQHKKFPYAQSTLEFAMVVIVVLFSIIVMGPYVVRSINAYMRSWEISVEQSKIDTTVQLDAWEVPGAQPPSPVDCSLFNNQSSCVNAVGEDGSQCTWIKEFVGFGFEDCEADIALSFCTSRSSPDIQGFQCCSLSCDGSSAICYVTNDVLCVSYCTQTCSDLSQGCPF